MRTVKVRRYIYVLKTGEVICTWQIWRLVLKGWATAENVRDDWNMSDVRKHYAAYGLNVEFEKVHFETED